MNDSAKHSDVDLMMLADGELDARASEALRAALEADADLASKLQGVEEIGFSVRTLLEHETDAAADGGKFDSLWTRVADGIAAHETITPPVAATEVARKKPGVASPASGGLWEAFRAWLGGGRLGTGLVAAAAVAAVFIVARPFERVVEHRVEVVRDVSADADAAPTRLVSQPAEVEKLEVYDGSGTILTIPGDGDDSSTTVIWISDTDTIEGPI